MFAAARDEVPSSKQHHRYVRVGDELVRETPAGSCHIPLPGAQGFTVGYWIKRSPFDGTLPWEWVITNMPVTVVTGMSSGYTHTRWGARRAVRRALSFWASLGYEVAST